jgi:hypothetical protein
MGTRYRFFFSQHFSCPVSIIVSLLHTSVPLSVSFHHCFILIHPSSTDVTNSDFGEKKTHLSHVTCSFNVGERESGRFRLGAAAAQRVH